MPSVRDASASATPTPPRAATRPRCRRKACGRRFTRKTPGQSYCTSNCRKRASEADAKTTPKTGPDLREQGTEGDHLGKKGKKFPDPNPKTPQELAAEAADRRRKERKRRNYSGLYYQWDHSKLKSIRGCRRSARDEGAGVTLTVSPDGEQVGRKGLNRCASVWACPVCETVIRGQRATDADTAITEHVRNGGMVLFVTFTVRHWSNHDLEDLIRVQVREVWKGLLQGRKWARSNAGNLRNRLGVVGTIRVIEVTVGQINGWHPHLHVAVFLGGRQDPKPKRGSGEKWDPTVREYFRPADADLDAFEAEWKAAWIDGVTAANPDFRPSARDGVDFKRVYTAKDAAAIGKYISKVQGTDVATDWSAGAELAMSHVKQARGGNMKAMDILFRLAALRGGQTADDLPGWGSIEQLVALWAEYELTTKGGQNMAWSEGLKRAYGIGTDENQDAADRQAVDAEDASEADATRIHMSARTQLEVGRKRIVVDIDEAASDAVRRNEDPVIAVRALLALVGIDSMGVWALTADEDEAKWKASAENASSHSGETDDARAKRKEREATDLRRARADRRQHVWKTAATTAQE
ncbi:hypothetical protein [Streptomyces anthocyanicus]|uniref:hypothetical protein n=1 Tax=Streptomyces anthocyanicus TaxID=68174 RepID=UPI00381E3F72